MGSRNWPMVDATALYPLCINLQWHPFEAIVRGYALCTPIRILQNVPIWNTTSSKMRGACRPWVYPSGTGQTLLTLCCCPVLSREHINKFPEEWQQYYDDRSPQEADLPKPWHSRLHDFQRMMVLRCIRPDKVCLNVTHGQIYFILLCQQWLYVFRHLNTTQFLTVRKNMM